MLAGLMPMALGGGFGGAMNQFQQSQNTPAQSQPPAWLTGMAQNQMPGLMNLFNPAPQSSFPMGGLLDFNAMASQLAGPMPNLPPPAQRAPTSSAPVSQMFPQLDWQIHNPQTIGYGPQQEAISRRMRGR